MTVDELIFLGKQSTHSDKAKILLAEMLNLNPLELLNHLEDKVSPEVVDKYKKAIVSLNNNYPLQYVLGYVNFYGNKFKVNENVLIPRFETEELVENTISLINKYFTNHVEIIDLGCGSGNETVYMLNHGIKVLAVDRQLNEQYILDRVDDSIKEK